MICMIGGSLYCICIVLTYVTLGCKTRRDFKNDTLTFCITLVKVPYTQNFYANIKNNNANFMYVGKFL